jgi:predicted RNA-binding Zn-ribbon protein involved in translation (DUF1610 family)
MLSPQDELNIKRFTTQRICLNLSHAGMFIQVVAYVVAAIYAWKYFSGTTDAQIAKGIIFAGGALLLILLGVLEKRARMRFWKCPSCGIALKYEASKSEAYKNVLLTLCPNCGARLRL